MGVVIVGCSFGAVLALLSAQTQPTATGVAAPPDLRAAVAFYGLPDVKHTGGSLGLWSPARVVSPSAIMPAVACGPWIFSDRLLVVAVHPLPAALSHRKHTQAICYAFIFQVLSDRFHLNTGRPGA